MRHVHDPVIGVPSVEECTSSSRTRKPRQPRPHSVHQEPLDMEDDDDYPRYRPSARPPRVTLRHHMASSDSDSDGESESDSDGWDYISSTAENRAKPRHASNSGMGRAAQNANLNDLRMQEQGFNETKTPRSKEQGIQINAILPRGVNNRR
jgi:hypothetical protein